MATFKRGHVWWYEFLFAGKRIRESAKTKRKTLAVECEKRRRLELERAYAGMPIEAQAQRIRTVNDVVKAYEEHYGINHRAKSVVFSKQRLAHVKRILSSVMLPDLTEERIRRYIKTRLDEEACGRTINMELGELSRAIGKPWSTLWPKVRKLEERKDVGRALAPDEEARLLGTLPRVHSPVIGFFVREDLLTGMRSGELQTLTWGQVDFEKRIVTVGKAKSEAGTGRQIPMNQELVAVLSAHASWFVSRFGELRSESYLFPYGKPVPNDPTKPTTTLKTAWASLRKKAGVNCRLHDIRHTVATTMAEAGVPESTMLALMGHMSRAMLERYCNAPRSSPS